MRQYEIDGGNRGYLRGSRITLLVLLLLLLFGSRSVARYAIEAAWWKEMGQFPTWLSILAYSIAPVMAGTVIAFAALWIAHAWALNFAGVSLRGNRLYARISTLALLLLSYFIAAASIDTWTVVRFAGSRGLPAPATAWHDAVFNKPLSFYLFDLPFYGLLRNYVLALAIFCIVIYWVAARAWQLRYRMRDFNGAQEFDPSLLRLEGGLESKFLRGAVVALLLTLAVRFFLARYEMVYDEHGTFLVGIDFVAEKIGLPLQWLLIAACLAAAGFVVFRRWMLAASMALALPVAFIVPRIVSAVYVRPNEISIQRPYIQTHIHATRSAYGIEQRVKEIEFAAEPDAPVDVAAHKAALDNVRLWDWQAFHDTITQRQALRTYYTFQDTDVDRYTIDGEYRQVLLSPRELDVRQLPEAASNWLNASFIYTHGYGVVLAEVAKITPEGLPVLLVSDAPPQIKTPSLKLSRPEIYYGESTHDPVFVNTAQQEFDYPLGEQYKSTRYAGRGGFPITSLPMRIAAAIAEGEPKIALTGYFTPGSRMMIRRDVRSRVAALADFLQWDSDPYLVITEEGRLVWILDGYTTSRAHPYSRVVNMGRNGPPVNYIRNAVKATVDAYDGETRFYVFAQDDPIIAAYQRLFPDLFLQASQMPAALRAHTRYPETYFRVQAEIYRTYHMLDPQSFYNKEDMWDVAQHSTQNESTSSATPTFLMATLPGESKPEFLLMLPFTPRNKNNLIGLMAARNDGGHLGEIVVLQLSKQQLILGPMNIAANINQDQTIAKDLTLWNQQGSRVLRGQIMVLPVGNNFLYVDPIYIQASQASMPQLKKVVLAVGNQLIYEDTYEQALARLSPGGQQLARQATEPAPGAASPPAQAQGRAPGAGADPRLQQVRDHLRRYRELSSEGRWSEAGRELEAIESLVR